MQPLILNIDTATPKASICLSIGNASIQLLSNENQTDHASWLHPAIELILKAQGKNLRDLDAIAVTSGPGSYTGIRVGLATAKGFCFTLSLPLILVNTLVVMARSARFQLQSESELVLCPMIDARRMEVFTAVYSKELEEIVSPRAIILDQEPAFFTNWDFKQPIIFFGDGSRKFRGICPPSLGNFSNFETDATHLAMLSSEMYRKGNFSDPFNAVPFYVKDFYSKPIN